MSIGGDGYDERGRTGGETGPSRRRGSAGDSAGGTGRLGTRTRLPGEDGDVYGVGRRSAGRPGRSLVTVVGVVVLLIAAIAFANRSGDGGGSDSGGTRADDGKDAAAQPTAPTGREPVTDKNAATGIPSGFAQSEQGAQSAAANYMVALGGDGMFDSASRSQIVDAVYAPDIAATRKASLDKVYGDAAFLKRIGLKSDGSTPSGLTFISRVIPVGTQTQEYDEGSAKVSVWYSSLFGLAGTDSKNPVSESWYTTTFDLKRAGDDWKVVDFKQKDGPTPVGRDQQASRAEEMSEAVEGFGGFTYAR
ncbi:hypothetical protein DVA86_24950 [Streptomyces armeniacus]|uniref:Uncharacterized protein n=1 Tax=Streptomyces armeniacus TaxID=83291 RepID=A0A345XUU7_9ACTN|nr:hypothetical protein [Streptomyces armeniacus]AXK35413.1 hypothetical protein DVA86_24950 [Streptomyces armeniacus]